MKNWKYRDIIYMPRYRVPPSLCGEAIFFNKFFRPQALKGEHSKVVEIRGLCVGGGCRPHTNPQQSFNAPIEGNAKPQQRARAIMPQRS
jgi:hypothetical protein